VTAYTQVEYDTYFDELNTILFSGTLDIGGDTTLSLLADHRRAPTLSMRNALFSSTTSSLDLLMQSMTSEELRALAKARTATSDFIQIGATRKMTKKWQVNGVFKLSNISGLPESGGEGQVEGHLLATDGTGIESTVIVQATGNNLFIRNDVFASSATVMGGASRNAYSLHAFYQMHFSDKWMLNTSMMIYTQKDPVNGKLNRYSPMLRTSYVFTDKLSADADMGVDFTDSEGSTSSNTATRSYFSVGMRWDF